MVKATRLTREAILNAKDITQEEVEVPQWGGTVLVQALSGKRRADIMEACMNKDGKMDQHKLYPRLLVAGCVDPAFERTDADALLEKNAGALEIIAKVLMRLSGMMEDDVEEAEKN